MKKVLNWFKSHIPTKRRLIQLYCALLFNAHLKGFVTGKIYQGPLKNLCAPGINCYSCPGASAACPIGALQNAFSASGKRAPYYVFGIILLYSIMFGRMICGFFCPFGLIQDLLHKIKTPKIKKSRITRVLSYFKYVVLVFITVCIPLLYMMKDKGVPSFCKYICPAGVLEGAIGLLSHADNAAELLNLGSLFVWKFSLFVTIILLCIFIYRFFCRFICPLGALYGLFNRFSILGIKLNRDKCVDCGRCHAKCKVDIRHVGDHECINCGECLDVCPTNAITWRGSKIFLPPNEVELEAKLERPVTEEEVAAEKKKVEKRSFVIRLVSLILASAVLIGSLVYYNFIYKDPSELVVSDKCIDGNGDLACDTCGIVFLNSDGTEIARGSAVGDMCLGGHLEVLDEDGKTSDIINPAVTDGKIVIINFWGVWCEGCKKELPDFNRIANDYAEDVTVIAIHTSTDETLAPGHIKSNYSDWNNMIFALDTRIDGAPADKYYTVLGFKSSYPVTVILNPYGEIEYKYESELTYEELKRDIEEIKFIYE